MSSEDDALVEALEKRISNLEAILLGTDPKLAQQLSKSSRYVIYLNSLNVIGFIPPTLFNDGLKSTSNHVKFAIWITGNAGKMCLQKSLN